MQDGFKKYGSFNGQEMFIEDTGSAIQDDERTEGGKEFRFGSQLKAVLLTLAAAIMLSGAVGVVNLNAKAVTLAFDGEGEAAVGFTTKALTVGEFLAERGVVLGEFDTVNAPLDAMLEDGAELSVARGVSVTVVVDGEFWRRKELETERVMLSRFVADYSAKTGGEYEYDMTGWSDELEDGMLVELTSRKTAVYDVSEVIPYETVVIEADDIDVGTVIPLTMGLVGELGVTVKVGYVGGAETYREVVAEAVTKEPTAQVLMVGTRQPGKTVDEVASEEQKAEEIRLEEERLELERQRLEQERLEQERLKREREEAERRERERQEAIRKENLKKQMEEAERALLSKAKASEVANLNYRKEIVMSATAYTADYASTGKSPGDPGFGITKSGMKAKVGVVAVDPTVIPLGTELYVEGYGYAIAGDTGGAIKGNKIDLFFDTPTEVKVFGRQMLRVYVLN